MASKSFQTAILQAKPIKKTVLKCYTQTPSFLGLWFVDFNKFKNDIERPIYSSLENLFDEADLDEAERKVFRQYKKYCEYSLLRTKKQNLQSFDGQPNYLKRLAAVIHALESNLVSGNKISKIKDLFTYKSKVHGFKKKPNSIRSCKNSPLAENTYFELEILSFFVSKGLTIELVKEGKKGKKVPEFYVFHKGMRIAVEAKNINIDSILDNLHGNHFINGFDYKMTPEERQKGFDGIKDQIQRNYENAIAKIVDIGADDLYLIFLSIFYNNRIIGTPAIEYLNSIQASWNQKHEQLMGVVIPEEEKTKLIKNKPFGRIECLDLIKYHEYIPRIK